MAELKPCPFCGGRADLDAPQGEDRMVYCIECCASICDDSNPDAIAAWNRRVSPPGATAPQPELTDEQINRAFALAYPPDMTSMQDRRIIARSLLAASPVQEAVAWMTEDRKQCVIAAEMEHARTGPAPKGFAEYMLGKYTVPLFASPAEVAAGGNTDSGVVHPAAPGSTRTSVEAGDSAPSAGGEG